MHKIKIGCDAYEYTYYLLYDYCRYLEYYVNYDIKYHTLSLLTILAVCTIKIRNRPVRLGAWRRLLRLEHETGKGAS